MESSIIFLPCRDLEETLKFYTEVVGMKLHHRDPAGAIWLDSNYGLLGFCQYAPDRPMATGVCISYNVADIAAVDEQHRRLSALGFVQGITEPCKHPRFGVYSFFFNDPNGYTLEYQKLV